MAASRGLAALLSTLLIGAIVWWARRPASTAAAESGLDPEPAIAIVTQTKSYKGYVVLRAQPSTQKQLEMLTSKALTPLAIDVDFWKEARDLRTPVVMMVNASAAPVAKSYLEANGVSYKVMMPDVQAAIEASQPKKSTFAKQDGDESNPDTYFTDYHSYDHIVQWMEGKAEESNDAEVFTLSQDSIEHRPIKGIKINADPSLPIIFLVCGMHAREWIGPASCSYVADRLLKGQAGAAAQGFEWQIVPVINPDGYEFSRDHDRMWRKNRRHNGGFFCGYGVDLERNWDWHSCQEDDETVCFGQAYCGEGAKPSEPEDQALVKWLEDLLDANRQIVGFVDIHSFSQLWMWPWGYTEDPVPEEDGKLMTMCGTAAAEALYPVHNTSFTVGPIASTIYTVGGSSVDWTYGKHGIVHSYAVELRDTGENGFVLPPEQIIPSGEELTAGLGAMASCIASTTVAAQRNRLAASGASIIF